MRGCCPPTPRRWENTRQIVDQPGLQPDILVTANGRAPVIIEAEFLPAYTAEPEAASRLNLEVAGTGKRVDAAVALRYPDGVADAPNLADAVRGARLSYAALYADGSRFPESGWLEGAVEDLSDLVRLLSVPQRAVDEAADALEKGIDRAASILEQLAESKPGVIASIAALLGMSEGSANLPNGGRDCRQRDDIPRTACWIARRQAAVAGVFDLGSQPQAGDSGGLDGDTQDQLLAYLRNRAGHRGTTAVRRGDSSF